ncbi:hypothetical protein [Microlunatus sp. Gsoil 973]|jgi:hypothetical protein|uniref:hypothetical protein n=1 Tax=Microlunatus sp. Gsoil 973 TaxID=2672569 RepID=UPI0012B4E19F|nr:hypothetical protein [Microlunatus sp. Gsoil 973]QGN33188.1 hypothetical protein GJV80_10650 [Microlunatus sp. Gsoil 973]
MPAAESVLLPLCVAIALIGVILAGLAWRRGNKGRVVQAAALVIVPFGLYLTGLLTVLWNWAVELVRWAVHLVFSPLHWIGFGILALSVVLFVIGAVLARLTGGTKTDTKAKQTKQVSGKPSGSGGRTPTKAVAGRKQQADVDPELAEIEALLKSRGIE